MPSTGNVIKVFKVAWSFMRPWALGQWTSIEGWSGPLEASTSWYPMMRLGFCSQRSRSCRASLAQAQFMGKKVIRNGHIMGINRFQRIDAAVLVGLLHACWLLYIFISTQPAHMYLCIINRKLPPFTAAGWMKEKRWQMLTCLCHRHLLGDAHHRPWYAYFS